MTSRLWYMNADFEVELSHTPGRYRPLPALDALNQRLARHLLWLALEGDALLAGKPWSEQLHGEAVKRGVELVAPGEEVMPGHTFTPWGWTPSAVAAGERAGAIVRPVALEIVKRVNSKLWSHALEVEQGWAQPLAATASGLDELRECVARACPLKDDKWVIKSPYGFAARDRVLGRGPHLEGPQAKWSERRLASGETLIFQPWLEVLREYGVVMEMDADGAHSIQGISDLQTNGAGTGRGYILGRAPAANRLEELERVAAIVAGRLASEGYHGPVGFDALEHKGGLHPLLEINARYTMGFVAVAVEQALKPDEPIFWSLD